MSQPAQLMLDLLNAGEHAPQRPAGQVAPFLDWCRCNKIPLMALAGRFPLWLAVEPAFAAALDAEETWYRTQRDEYLRVRDAWQTRGIDCLMIKPAGNPPSFPHTSDNIDILVRPADGRMARDTLRQLGYVEIRNVEEPQKFLFRRFHSGSCVSAIHVHERIAWFVGFLDDARVWERSAPALDDPAVRIPSPEDAILINLAHACYENKELRLVEVLRVRHALAAAGAYLDWSYMEEIATQRGWRDGLAFMLLVHAHAERSLFGETLIPATVLARCEESLAGDTSVLHRLREITATELDDLPIDLSYVFCKRLYYRKILRDPASDRQRRLRDVAATLIWGIKLKSGLRPQPGMVVSISGPDGAGKTAHAERLVAAIQLCELRADYLWHRGGSSNLFRLLSRSRVPRVGAMAAASPCLDRAEKGEAAAIAPTRHNREDSIQRRQAKLQRSLTRFGWAWLLAGEQLATTVWRIWLPARRGRVIVTDRAAWDTAVEMDVSLPAGARWSRLAIAAMLRLTPRPDLAYVLDVSHETAQSRKPDEDWHSSWEDERRRYRALADHYGLRLLSTEGAFDRSSDPLIHDVLMALMARYETRLNGLLYSNPSQKNVPDPIWAKGSAQ